MPSLSLTGQTRSEGAASHLRVGRCRTDPPWLRIGLVAERIVIVIHTDMIPEAFQ
jgi:hypothetical protein